VPPYLQVMDESAWENPAKIVAKIFARSPDADVGDGVMNTPIRRVDGNLDPPRVCELHRVAEQVTGNLSEAHRVPEDRR